jgi:hypothetical protein
MSIEKPKGEKIVEEALVEATQDLASEMSEMRANPRLSLSSDEIQKVLLMDKKELGIFLNDKGIDFTEPISLETPDGIAEPWMSSAEDINRFLVKRYSN